MPTKLNKAGNEQPYVPQGNGDASGEYADNQSGSNKHFKVFKKPTEPQNKITESVDELKKQLETEKGIFNRSRIREKIAALENGFDNVEEYKKFNESKRKSALEEFEKSKIEKQKAKEFEETKKKQQLEKEIKEAPEHKRKQFLIIQKENPMLDDYHVGIRSPKDIKTFDEVVEDEDSFAWGDFSRKDAKKALKENKITVYSSYPIKQGVFVSTSMSQAKQYAGGKKVYSAKIPLDNVAWINGDEGQFAKID